MDSGGRDVSDMTLKGTSVTAAEAASRSAVLKRLRLTDTVFHGLTRAAAFAVLVLLSGVIIALIIGAAPALSTFGFCFFSTSRGTRSPRSSARWRRSTARLSPRPSPC